MPMRDAEKWAAVESERAWPSEIIEKALARIIREAQEDGARAECERLDGTIRKVLEEKREDCAMLMAARDAAIARAEKAEREANGFNELLVETLDKLTEAECDRDEAVRVLDTHKERADRAESELHRRKW